MLNESQITATSQSNLRYCEAQYFLEQFIHYCGNNSSIDSYFHVIAYLDAFLLTLISIEELDRKEQKKALNTQPIFKFLKAARNFTAHKFILASPANQSTFQRAITENLVVGGGGTAYARLYISTQQFDKLFAEGLEDKKREQNCPH
jgi:hypothetical protein